MRILFLTPYLPNPPQSGGRRRLHELMSGLARTHSVSVVSLVEAGGDHAQAIAATRAYCDEVVTVPSDRSGLLATRRKRALQARSLLSPWSFERSIYRRPAYQAALDAALRREPFDVVSVEFAQMTCYRVLRAGAGAGALILDEHNVEYDILRRTAATEAGAARKLYNYLDFLKLRREERASWRRVDGCSLTSSRDRDLLQREVPSLPTAVVPNGVDTAAFAPSETAPAEPMTLVFFGAIDYYPNTHGLLFFLNAVFPRIKQRHPRARLVIVGQSPPDSIRAWESDDVIVTGLVADVRPYLARAAAIVVPLHIGGGTRLKILEAMAMGKAIVSTRIGAEGIDVGDGRDILLGDSAEEFAAQVCRLLDNPELSRRIGNGARELVVRAYDWQESVRMLEGFYREVAARYARSAPARHAVAS
ncbi:MAG TPA: glycosyltransferase [Thermomicrobiaceae bacterium]|nr:glycosyltransferase [Thermomicrobiaceae bacterium]